MSKHTTLEQLKKLALRTKTELTSLDEKKQDVLVFNTPYNASTNKAATMSDVNGAVAGLQGAMHFRGDSTTDPMGESGPTVPDHTGPWAAGDVVTYQTEEFLYNGSTWRPYGKEGDYAIKGSIADSDIATGANIQQSKIAGLTDALDGKVNAEAGKRLMTDAEGTLLASVSNGANKVEASTTPGNVKIDGAETQIMSDATASAAGMMSAADKAKLDGFEEATNTEVDAMLNEVFGAETPAA